MGTGPRTNEQRDGEAVSDDAEHAQDPAAADVSRVHDATPTAELTGHGAVDEVLGSLDGLEGLPVGEHVAVFEAAHEALRAALAEAGDRSGGTTR
jgi:hypothetical protein